MIWVDAQLAPAVADWITKQTDHPAQAVRVLGLQRAADIEIFQAARQANAIILTKDADFVDLLEQRGPPPQIIWLTCGNTSTAALQTVLQERLPQALALLRSGESLVEIS